VKETEGERERERKNGGRGMSVHPRYIYPRKFLFQIPEHEILLFVVGNGRNLVG
jgi:hypothetical protein